MMPSVVEPKSTVVSMIHIPFESMKPGLIPTVFKIAAGTMEKPSINYIGAAKHNVYLDGDRGSLQVRDASYEVARSIVEDWISSQMGISEDCTPGLFWIPQELTLEEIEDKFPGILATARESHQRWMLRLTQLADDDFARYQKHNVISDFQRRVGEILKLNPEKHPWMSMVNTLESSSCPGCGSLYRPGIAFCPICRTVLDKEKAATLEIVGK